MTFAFFHTYPPYSWEKDGKLQGILIDIATEIIENRLGVTAEYHGYPWERAQINVRDGNNDAFITTPIPSRKLYAGFIEENVLF